MSEDEARDAVTELIEAATSAAIAEDRGTRAEAEHWEAERDRLAAEMVRRLASLTNRSVGTLPVLTAVDPYAASPGPRQDKSG